MKKLLISLLILSGCSTASTSTQNIGMVHDYVFRQAQQDCAPHEGLHYIVSVETVYKKNSGNSSFDDFPCTSKYKFRCQDGSLLDFDDGTAFCFISQSQLQESLEGK